MRKVSINTTATENKNSQSQNTSAASFEQKPSRTATNAGKANVKEKAPEKKDSEKKALRWADLTEEQQTIGKSFLWIMERRELNGVRQLEIDKTADPVIIRAAEGLDEKATLRATGRISNSARRVLGGKYDADSHAYSFPRKEFVKWVAYYKAAVAEGITTLDAASAPTEKPQTEGKKTSGKTKTEKSQVDDTLITKADALARCRKFLAQQVFSKAMMECIEDELKAIFA